MESMTIMPQTKTTDSIKTYITQHFFAARKRRLKASDPLLQSGIIDSMGILDLVGYLETSFEISILDDDLLPENFDSIETIATFVEKKQRQNQLL
jgi:acyl carrier protein